MSPEMISPPYRVILCSHSGKPVHLPKNIIRRANSIRNEESNSTQHLLSRVFLLRCRSCVREAVYTIDQVIDCLEDAMTFESPLERERYGKPPLNQFRLRPNGSSCVF